MIEHMKYLIQKFGFFALLLASVTLFLYYQFAPLAFYGIFSGTLLCVALLERTYPFEHQWNMPDGNLRQDLFYAVATILMGPIAQTISTYLVVGMGAPAWTHASPIGAWSGVWQVLAGLLISGLLPYWYHRLSHTQSAFWWRIHAIHHSPEKLYWLNGLRLHPVNALLNALLGLAPLMLLGFSRDSILLVGFINNYVSVLNHTNIDFQLGLFNYLFNMNEVHRWHHSHHLTEGNHNYSSGALVVWDLIFGSYYLPARPIDARGLGLFAESKQGFPYKALWRQLWYPFGFRD